MIVPKSICEDRSDDSIYHWVGFAHVLLIQMIDDVLTFLDENGELALADLKRIVRIPSIAAKKEGIEECAEMVLHGKGNPRPEEDDTRENGHVDQRITVQQDIAKLDIDARDRPSRRVTGAVAAHAGPIRVDRITRPR